MLAVLPQCNVTGGSQTRSSPTSGTLGNIHMRNTILAGCSTLALAASLLAGAAQAAEIRGQIFDQGSNASLPGARIHVEGTGITVLSGADGSFRFRVWHRATTS